MSFGGGGQYHGQSPGVLAFTGQPWATLLWASVPPESNAHSRVMGAGDWLPPRGALLSWESWLGLPHFPQPGVLLCEGVQSRPRRAKGHTRGPCCAQKPLVNDAVTSHLVTMGAALRLEEVPRGKLSGHWSAPASVHLYLPWSHCPALTLELRNSWRSFWRSQDEGGCWKSLCLQMSGQTPASKRAKKHPQPARTPTPSQSSFYSH